VREREQGLGEVGLAGREEERLARPVLKARGEPVARERPVRGQAVEVGVGAGVGAVRAQQCGDGLIGFQRGAQAGAGLDEGLACARYRDPPVLPSAFLP
jgi:hypothetical protein